MRLIRAVVFAVVVAGCTKPLPPTSKTCATRVTVEDSSNPGKVATSVITDPSAIQSLESLFPGYQARPESDVAAAYDPPYVFTFDLRDGSSVRVIASSGCDVWSAGQGDLQVSGDLKKVLAAAVARVGRERGDSAESR
jgi:hypothetical protein